MTVRRSARLALEAPPVFEQEPVAEVTEREGEGEVRMLGPDQGERRVRDASGHVPEAAEHLGEGEDERRRHVDEGVHLQREERGVVAWVSA